MPAQKSFTRLDSEPISSPRARRASVRWLCSRKISSSIQDCASRCRRTGSALAPRCAHVCIRSSMATSASTCSFQMNVVPRSLANVVLATRQPSCSGPMRFSTGTSTSSRKTSLNSLFPVIWRSGRISTPLAVIGIASIEIPLCGGASGSVRTSAMAQFGEARVRRPHLLAGHAVDVAVLLAHASRGSPGRSRRRAR